MRMRSAGSTLAPVNVSDIKCEPDDDFLGGASFPEGCVGIEDVKPNRSEIVPATEYCVATTSEHVDQDEESLCPNEPIDIQMEDIKSVPASQLFSNDCYQPTTSNDVKPCVGDVSNRVQIKVVRQDICTIESDAIVNAVDVYLKSDDAAIVTAGGPNMQTDLEGLKNTLPSYDGYCFATSSHGIETCQAVLHTVVPRFHCTRGCETRMKEYLLRSCYLNCLSAAEGNGFTKMAFPVLGSPGDSVAKFSVLVALQSVLIHLQLNPNLGLKELIFVASDDRVYESFKSILEGKTEMDVSVESAQEVRTKLERAHVTNVRLHMKVSPVPGLPFLVGSFVMKWVSDKERKTVRRLASNPVSVEEIPELEEDKKKSRPERSEASRMKSLLRKREQRKSEDYRKRQAEYRRERRLNNLERRKRDAECRKREAERKRERRKNDPEWRQREALRRAKNREREAERKRERRKNDPEWRKKEALQREKNREKEAARKREKAADPEYKARVAARKRAQRDTDEYREREAERRRQRFLLNPEIHERTLAYQREKRKDEQRKIRAAELKQAKLADPEYRARVNAMRRMRRSTEEFRERKAEKQKEREESFNAIDLLEDGEPEQILVNVAVNKSDLI